MTRSNLDPKHRRARVRKDGVSPTGARRAPAERIVERAKQDAPLETYEQPARRETDDPRSGPRRNDGSVEGTARDEP